jgi:hypothetical protein
MKRIPLVVIFIVIISYPVSTFAQRGPNPKNLLDQLGRNANSYFLSANRPSYDISAYIVDKKTFELSIDPSFGSGTSELPLTFSYGLSNRVQLFAGIDVYDQTFRFDGRKASGFGDANIGFTYKFQSSKKFTHVFQILVKIPTASATEQVGTGHPDYHFGIAEGFTSGKFGYELSLELGMLHRRDLPAVLHPNGVYTQGLLDSIKAYYDYNFEPEIKASFTPTIYFSESFLAYTGLEFSRNTKLNYNSGDFYLGLGYLPSELIYLSLGISKPVVQNSTASFSAGIAFTFK